MVIDGVHNLLLTIAGYHNQGKRVKPHVGPLTKVIPLELFIDVVPSRVSCGFLLARCLDSRSDFFETTWDEMAGKSFYLFWQQSHLLHSRPSFCSAELSFSLCSFVCNYLAVYSVLGILISKLWRQRHRALWLALCKRAFLFISSLLFAKGRKTTTWSSHILHIQENVNSYYMTAKL